MLTQSWAHSGAGTPPAPVPGTLSHDSILCRGPIQGGLFCPFLDPWAPLPHPPIHCYSDFVSSPGGCSFTPLPSPSTLPFSSPSYQKSSLKKPSGRMDGTRHTLQNKFSERRAEKIKAQHTIPISLGPWRRTAFLCWAPPARHPLCPCNHTAFPTCWVPYSFVFQEFCSQCLQPIPSLWINSPLFHEGGGEVTAEAFLS